MSSFCFVTPEFFPVTAGGAGTLIYNLLHSLGKAGHRLSLLLDVEEEVFARIQAYLRDHPIPGVAVERCFYAGNYANDIAPLADQLPGWYHWRSYLLSFALSQCIESEKFDYIEFVDFFGPAYYTLAKKAGGQEFQDTIIGVRLHTPWELLLASGDGAEMKEYILEVRALERASIRLADIVLSPSGSYLRLAEKEGYRITGTTFISKPPIDHWPKASDQTGQKSEILFYGRLQPMKGLDVFLAGAVEIAQCHPQVFFTFVGSDSVVTRKLGSRSYQEDLLQRVPVHLQGQFRFLGRLSFEQLSDTLSRTLFAVFPNYFESFCYALHEISLAGIPVLINQIPAFNDYFLDGQNAWYYDGSALDLASKMEEMLVDARKRDQIHPRLDQRLDTSVEVYQRATARENPRPSAPSLDLRVLIVGDQLAEIHATVRSLEKIVSQDRIYIIDPNGLSSQAGSVLFLDQLTSLKNSLGEACLPSEFRCGDALLILNAGDVFLGDRLVAWAAALQADPRLSFVTSWKKRTNLADSSQWIDRQPFDLALEKLLFWSGTVRNRALMRTKPGTRLEDLFDMRVGSLGEIDYLWSLDNEQGPGVCIPEVHLSCRDSDFSTPVSDFPAAAAVMVARERDPNRLKSLAYRSLISRDRVELPDAAAVRIAAILRRLRAQKLVVSLSKLPGASHAKRVIKKLILRY